jgi:hypothetical protein
MRTTISIRRLMSKVRLLFLTFCCTNSSILLSRSASYNPLMIIGPEKAEQRLSQMIVSAGRHDPRPYGVYNDSGIAASVVDIVDKKASRNS